MGRNGWPGAFLLILLGASGCALDKVQPEAFAQDQTVPPKVAQALPPASSVTLTPPPLTDPDKPLIKTCPTALLLVNDMSVFLAAAA
jgi:hypothetical protein